MEFLDWTCDTPAENLALDEALLVWAEHREVEILDGNDPTESRNPVELVDTKNPSFHRSHIEWLRLWESTQPFVVLGRSSRADAEVDLAACQLAKLPVLRRSSGGAAVVVGPGCLMVTLVLSYAHRPELRAIDRAHRFVIGRHVTALQPIVPQITMAGTSDIVFGEPPRKFSGNSLRCKRTHLLYHGTLLYDFDLSLITRYLHSPPRQPDYRNGREHASFVANLPASGALLAQAIRTAWNPRLRSTLRSCELNKNHPDPMGDLIRLADGLVSIRYGNAAWTWCFP
ncbi:MAG: lipoate--protein ligase family protein [Pirellulales bacterium]|nr:lipoate--protein ligase family protein [Pirellulales bacterium]